MGQIVSYAKNIYYWGKCPKCQAAKLDNICTNCYLLTMNAPEWDAFDAEYYELVHEDVSDGEDSDEVMTVSQFLAS